MELYALRNFLKSLRLSYDERERLRWENSDHSRARLDDDDFTHRVATLLDKYLCDHTEPPAGS